MASNRMVRSVVRTSTAEVSSDGRRSVWLVHSRAVTNHDAEFSLLIWRVADTCAAPRLTQHLHCEQQHLITSLRH